MKNKKILILLGIVLLSFIILLSVYAFSLNDSSTQLIQPSLTIKPSQQLATESKKRSLAKIEALKKEINGMTNETFSVDETVYNRDDEDSKKYRKKIISGQAMAAEGIITEKKDSFLKIKFRQDSSSWTSTVIVDKKTSISTINAQSEKKQISLNNLEIGDKVIIKATENITNADFIAINIFKFVQN